MNIDDIRKEEGAKQYFWELLRRLALAAQEANSRTLFKDAFDAHNGIMKKNIIDGLSVSLESCDGKSVVLTKHDIREKIKEEYREKYNDKLLPRKDAIIYSGHPKSTFDKKAKKIKKKKDGSPHLLRKDGPPYYHMDDLDKFAKLILDSSESALCIKTNYCFDIVRDGYIQFEEGIHYKIIEKQEEFKYLYNERFDITIKMSDKQFSENFRTKGELEYDANDYIT